MGRVNIRSNQNHNFKTSHRVSFVVRNNSNKTVKRIRQDNKLAKLGRCDIWKHFWQDGIMVIWLGCSRTHQVTAWRLVWRNSKNLSGQNLEGTLAISVLINFALFFFHSGFSQLHLARLREGWVKIYTVKFVPTEMARGTWSKSKNLLDPFRPTPRLMLGGFIYFFLKWVICL